MSHDAFFDDYPELSSVVTDVLAGSSEPGSSHEPQPATVDADEHADLAPVSLRHDDHVESVQNLAGRSGSSQTEPAEVSAVDASPSQAATVPAGSVPAPTVPTQRPGPVGAASDAVLRVVSAPGQHSAVQVGASARTKIVNVEESVLDALRTQVSLVLTEVYEVPHPQARAWAWDLSVPRLVLGFVLAHLDVSVEVDETTSVVATVFGHRSPLAAMTLDRVSELGESLERMETRLGRVHEQVRSLDQTQAVVEHLVSFQIADRLSRLISVGDSPDSVNVVAKPALDLRDVSRRQVTAQVKAEREARGRSGGF